MIPGFHRFNAIRIGFDMPGAASAYRWISPSSLTLSPYPRRQASYSELPTLQS